MADNDRQLLEDAAKAAGHMARTEVCCGEFQVLVAGRWWRPLEDDGDALRLAVELWLEIRTFNGKSHAGRQGEFWCTETQGGDPYAATRRAIVRAAAAMGGTT